MYRVLPKFAEISKYLSGNAERERRKKTATVFQGLCGANGFWQTKRCQRGRWDSKHVSSAKLLLQNSILELEQCWLQKKLQFLINSVVQRYQLLLSLLATVTKITSLKRAIFARKNLLPQSPLPLLKQWNVKVGHKSLKLSPQFFSKVFLFQFVAGHRNSESHYRGRTQFGSLINSAFPPNTKNVDVSIPPRIWNSPRKSTKVRNFRNRIDISRPNNRGEMHSGNADQNFWNDSNGIRALLKCGLAKAADIRRGCGVKWIFQFRFLEYLEQTAIIRAPPGIFGVISSVCRCAVLLTG